MSVAKKTERPGLYPLKAIKNREEYEAALISMEQVFDETQGPLAEYAETLSILIEYYEDNHFPTPEASGTDALEFLMDQNGLKPGDLADIFGSESAVSKILHRERPLNLNHIKLLAEYFNVRPATFV